MSEHSEGQTAREYSQRLGPLAPHQFQAALDRFDLGTFVEAAPISGGLFGQNVYVTSTKGRYVLRGCPHYDWQFPKERYGAALLHARTQIPVAYPYLLDASTDIFGWHYMLMPRMPGVSAMDPQLTEADKLSIARALGENLARLHTLTWEFAGEYDLASDSIQPFVEGFAPWFVADVRDRLEMARGHGTATTDDDVAWIEKLIGEAQSALAVPFQPCFVMNDYNPGNLVVDRLNGAWCVTGLFDLMEYYFGDGEADLMRLMAIYLEHGQHQDSRLAQAFGQAYLENRPARPGFVERYALYMLRDRLIIWEYGTRFKLNWFPEGQSFLGYAEPYLLSYRLFESYTEGVRK